MVVALGITLTGDKRFLGFVETDTENEKVLTPFLRSLVERGLDISQGLLVIVDGGQGLPPGMRINPSGVPPTRTPLEAIVRMGGYAVSGFVSWTSVSVLLSTCRRYSLRSVSILCHSPLALR